MSDPTRSTTPTFRTQELDIERRILRARTAAVDALEQRNWDAVVLSCGKVLQEVARNELPYNEHGGTLPQLLERLARKLQTDQPVSELAAALKDAGGLRGFFDLESDVDEELARATLSVVESFLTYTYAFREEVRHLSELAAAHRAAGSVETGSVETDSVESRPVGADPVETGHLRTAAPPAGAGRSAMEGPAAPDVRRPVAEQATSARDREEWERQEHARPESRERRDAQDRSPRPATGRGYDRPHSVFDQFEDRKDDPIRQTWQPKRSED